MEEVAARTLMNLEYIGEWHSHPACHSTQMSGMDRTAMADITEHMGTVGLPGLMLIIGDAGTFTVYLR